MTSKNIVYRVARIWAMLEYRFLCKRNLTLILALLFLMDIFLRPIEKFAEISDCRVTPWIFPFLISDANFLMVYTAGIICFFSCVPFLDKKERYYLIREGRYQWFADQVSVIVVSSFLVTVISVVISCLPLLPMLEFRCEWGKVIFTLAKTNVGNFTGLFWNISYWFLNGHEPLEAMFISVLIVSLGNCFLGMVMLLIRLFLPGAYSVFIVSVLVIYSSVVLNVSGIYEKPLFRISPVSWMRITRLGFTEYGFRVSWSAAASIGAFAILLLVMGIVGHYRITKVDFL